MSKHRSHSVAFKRQVAQESIAGETLHALSKRHDISRQLIPIWVRKFETDALDEDVQAADLIQEYEAKIAVLEWMVGRQGYRCPLISLLDPEIVSARYCLDPLSVWHDGPCGSVLRGRLPISRLALAHGIM